MKKKIIKSKFIDLFVSFILKFAGTQFSAE